MNYSDDDIFGRNIDQLDRETPRYQLSEEDEEKSATAKKISSPNLSEILRSSSDNRTSSETDSSTRKQKSRKLSNMANSPEKKNSSSSHYMNSSGHIPLKNSNHPPSTIASVQPYSLVPTVHNSNPLLSPQTNKQRMPTNTYFPPQFVQNQDMPFHNNSNQDVTYFNGNSRMNTQVNPLPSDGSSSAKESTSHSDRNHLVHCSPQLANNFRPEIGKPEILPQPLMINSERQKIEEEILLRQRELDSCWQEDEFDCPRDFTAMDRRKEECYAERSDPNIFNRPTRCGQIYKNADECLVKSVSSENLCFSPPWTEEEEKHMIQQQKHSAHMMVKRETKTCAKATANYPTTGSVRGPISSALASLPKAKAVVSPQPRNQTKVNNNNVVRHISFAEDGDALQDFSTSAWPQSEMGSRIPSSERISLSPLCMSGLPSGAQTPAEYEQQEKQSDINQAEKLQTNSMTQPSATVLVSTGKITPGVFEQYKRSEQFKMVMHVPPSSQADSVRDFTEQCWQQSEMGSRIPSSEQINLSPLTMSGMTSNAQSGIQTPLEPNTGTIPISVNSSPSKDNKARNNDEKNDESSGETTKESSSQHPIEMLPEDATKNFSNVPQSELGSRIPSCERISLSPLCQSEMPSGRTSPVVVGDRKDEVKMRPKKTNPKLEELMSKMNLEVPPRLDDFEEDSVKNFGCSEKSSRIASRENIFYTPPWSAMTSGIATPSGLGMNSKPHVAPKELKEQDIPQPEKHGSANCEAFPSVSFTQQQPQVKQFSQRRDSWSSEESTCSNRTDISTVVNAPTSMHNTAPGSPVPDASDESDVSCNVEETVSDLPETYSRCASPNPSKQQQQQQQQDNSRQQQKVWNNQRAFSTNAPMKDENLPPKHHERAHMIDESYHLGHNPDPPRHNPESQRHNPESQRHNPESQRHNPDRAPPALGPHYQRQNFYPENHPGYYPPPAPHRLPFAPHPLHPHLHRGYDPHFYKADHCYRPKNDNFHDEYGAFNDRPDFADYSQDFDMPFPLNRMTGYQSRMQTIHEGNYQTTRSDMVYAEYSQQSAFNSFQQQPYYGDHNTNPHNLVVQSSNYPSNHRAYSITSLEPNRDSPPHSDTLDAGSVISFASQAASNNNLDTKADMMSSLLSMLGTHDPDDMARTLLAMSSSPESCVAMRQSGCIPLLLNLLHHHDSDIINWGARQRAGLALHNIIHSNANDRRGKREVRVLRLLEIIRSHSEAVLSKGDQNYRSNRVTTPLREHGPGPAVAAIMKLSFEEEHKNTICELGGLQTIGEILAVDFLANSQCKDPYSIALRKYAGMVLINLTYNDSTNKAILSTLPNTINAIIAQLHLTEEEDLVQVFAGIIRNVSWRPDQNTQKALQTANAVRGLMTCIQKLHSEVCIRAVLSAVWNLSAHSSANKEEICRTHGSLEFLAFALSYRSPTNSLSVTENAGGILRNISSHIAVSNEYRRILRHGGCMQTLVSQLRSPSTRVVSNSTGILWNLSARCVEDQELLWDLGAVSVLKTLIHSKHKSISASSAAALRNLLAVKPGSGTDTESLAAFQHNRTNSLPLRSRNARAEPKYKSLNSASRSKQKNAKSAFTNQFQQMVGGNVTNVCDTLSSFQNLYFANRQPAPRYEESLMSEQSSLMYNPRPIPLRKVARDESTSSGTSLTPKNIKIHTGEMRKVSKDKRDKVSTWVNQCETKPNAYEDGSLSISKDFVSTCQATPKQTPKLEAKRKEKKLSTPKLKLKRGGMKGSVDMLSSKESIQQKGDGEDKNIWVRTIKQKMFKKSHSSDLDKSVDKKSHFEMYSMSNFPDRVASDQCLSVGDRYMCGPFDDVSKHGVWSSCEMVNTGQERCYQEGGSVQQKYNTIGYSPCTVAAVGKDRSRSVERKVFTKKKGSILKNPLKKSDSKHSKRTGEKQKCKN